MAGTGNDTMIGGAGNNNFVYRSTDGNLTIQDMGDANQTAYSNTLQFGDLNASDVTLTQQNNDLVIAIAGTGKTITVASEFAATGNNGIQAITFANGSQWQQSDILQHVQHNA